ncbi:MAG: hypothetical protein HY718_12495 [Planctomycetes bacterium]|nr:hypothetical protein [Planctomycetota bacterium]
MKGGSTYAKRLRQLFQRMVRKLGKPELSEPTDPLQQLIVGILAENTSEAKATAVLKRIREHMVDLNELRVTPALELADLIGASMPQAHEKAERIVRTLNEIRSRQDTLDLSFLRQRGRREAREYLESLDGIGPAAAASVVVHSLGGHAIPVDYLTLYVLRNEEIVHGAATPAQVQSFLERHVAAADVRLFATLLNRHVAAEGARVAVGRLPELLNLPPLELPRPARKPGLDRALGPGLPKTEPLVLPSRADTDVEDERRTEPEPRPAGRDKKSPHGKPSADGDRKKHAQPRTAAAPAWSPAAPAKPAKTKAAAAKTATASRRKR